MGKTESVGASIARPPTSRRCKHPRANDVRPYNRFAIIRGRTDIESAPTTGRQPVYVTS